MDFLHFVLHIDCVLQHLISRKTCQRRHNPSPECRPTDAVNSGRISNPICFDRLQNPWGDGVPEQGLSSYQSDHPDSRRPLFFPLLFHHVPSLDRDKHQRQHQHGRQLDHPSLLARHVGAPLALLARGARQAAQEASSPVAVHPRGRDPGRRAGGGGRTDAEREGLPLDQHRCAARSGAEEDSDAREGRGQSVVRERTQYVVFFFFTLPVLLFGEGALASMYAIKTND